jgi:ribosomal protein S18 acetylase RimI-like enzyme
MGRMMKRYRGFHQQALLADGRAVEFYRRLGFRRAGATEPLWIFAGDEHD